MPETKLLTIKNMTRMAICVALCCICAYISIPIPFTVAMLTTLTLAMNLTAFILPWKETLIVMVLYVVLGAVGLPVFAAGTAGFGRLLGPAGGFYLSFIVAYPVVSFLKGKTMSFKRYFFVAVFLGIPLTYVGGVASLVLVLDYTIYQGILGMIAFIPLDILKAAIAAYIAIRLNKIFTA